MSLLFSIVIPVFNVELYIEKCLMSCINQENFSIDEYEIIVVNDGTQDNSLTIVEKVKNEFYNHNIKIVNRENGGLSAARNTGLENVRGKYVWFVDSDDWIANDALFNLKKKINQNNNPEIITFRHTTVFSDGTYSKTNSGEDLKNSGLDFLKSNSFLSACCCVYAVSFLKENDFTFKEGILWEDSELNLKAYALANNHYFLAKPLYFYLRRDSSITTKGTSFKMVDSWFKKVSSVNSYFLNKKYSSREESTIINYHLATTIISAVAGFEDLPKNEREYFRKKIKNDKKYFLNIFKDSGNFKIKYSGYLIVYALPIAEKVFKFLIKRAIKRGEGK